MAVNVPNDGYLPDVAAGAIVEVGAIGRRRRHPPRRDAARWASRSPGGPRPRSALQELLVEAHGQRRPGPGVPGAASRIRCHPPTRPRAGRCSTSSASCRPMCCRSEPGPLHGSDAPPVPSAGGRARAAGAPLGPGSLLWSIAGDPRGLLTGSAAGIMQLMLPGLGAGVTDHSNFFDDPFDRIFRSIPYIWGSIFSEGDEGDERGRQIRDFHPDIKGTDEQGRRYHALDPEIFWWAHATFTWEFFRAQELYFARPAHPCRAGAALRRDRHVVPALRRQRPGGAARRSTTSGSASTRSAPTSSSSPRRSAGCSTPPPTPGPPDACDLPGPLSVLDGLVGRARLRPDPGAACSAACPTSSGDGSTCPGPTPTG